MPCAAVVDGDSDDSYFFHYINHESESGLAVQAFAMLPRRTGVAAYRTGTHAPVFPAPSNRDGCAGKCEL